MGKKHIRNVERGRRLRKFARGLIVKDGIRPRTLRETFRSVGKNG